MPKTNKNKTAEEMTAKDIIAEENAKLEKRGFEGLIKQIEKEYEIAWRYMKPKFDEWTLRLKVYNNQKRDKESVGDPLLFTVFQTVLASLYEDRLGVEFLGREAGDEDVGENLNQLAKFDYDEMEKDQLDYEWDWDACFFGRGLMLNMEFDKELQCPTPEVIDPMTFLRDPSAKSVSGDVKGRGAMQYGGYEFRMTKREMEDAGVFFNLKGLRASKASDIHSNLDRSTELRAEAQGLQAMTHTKGTLDGDNKEYKLLNWFTYHNGKPVLVTLADDKKRVVRYRELQGKGFPINDRVLFPMAHDWDGVSIPDIVEDKQRARAVLLNLGLKTAKLGVQPRFLYDTNKITNKNDLNTEFNKHIGVNGQIAGAIQEVQVSGVKQEVQFIMDILSAGAERAMATPDQQVGIPSEDKRTATEIQEVSSNIDRRFSLSARIFGWSEKRFWRQWYNLYKLHFEEDIDEKVIRIRGAMGAQWRGIQRQDIIGSIDPDIVVESRTLSEARRMSDLQSFRAYLADLAGDPNANIRYARKKLGKLHGLRKDEIDRLLPPTIDEMVAEEENETLNANKVVNVDATDDHVAHIDIHNKAEDTPAKFAHMNAHKKALMLKKQRPELFPEVPSDLNPDEEGVNPEVELPTMGDEQPVGNSALEQK